MLTFISFLLVCVGCINWFCIGLLQYDFVAGIFGSQSNIFSRLVYALVGIASIVVIINTIKNKGKFVISFKKSNKEYENYVEEKRNERKASLAHANAEADMDRAIDTGYANKIEASQDNHLNNHHSTEAGIDNSKANKNEKTTLEKNMSMKDDM